MLLFLFSLYERKEERLKTLFAPGNRRNEEREREGQKKFWLVEKIKKNVRPLDAMSTVRIKRFPPRLNT
jgi:hypothetical protein